MCSRPMPSSRLRSRGALIALHYSLLFDVGSDVEDSDIVDVVEVVPKIELGEPERDVEFGVVGGQVGCVHEGYCYVGSMFMLGSVCGD